MHRLAGQVLEVEAQRQAGTETDRKTQNKIILIIIMLIREQELDEIHIKHTQQSLNFGASSGHGLVFSGLVCYQNNLFYRLLITKTLG